MAQQSKQRSSTMHQPQHRISESMSNYHDDDYPSRPPQRPPRRSRSHADAFDRPEQSFEENQSRSRPQRQTAPQHHALSPEMGDASTFDFFYQLIFSIVHAALSLVLSPVLGNGKGNKVRSSSQSLQPKMDDPELAMEEEVDYINPSYVRTNSNNGAYAPILRTDARRSAGEIEKKSVRFPEPQRQRPPLGRIGLSSSRSLSSTSSAPLPRPSSSRRPHYRSDDRSVTSTESEPSYFRGERSSRSNFPRHGGRRARSPLGRLASSRMHHSSYFLE